MQQGFPPRRTIAASNCNRPGGPAGPCSGGVPSSAAEGREEEAPAVWVWRHAGVPSPRYTSYPTAADFTSDFDAGLHAAWLGGLGASAPVSIYLHVPYCRELCHYCGCHAKSARRASVVEAYRESLEAEILLAASHLSGRPPVSRIAWGGGTPSILGRDGIASVLRALGATFDLQPCEEHAIELDPRLVDLPLAEALADLGVTRVSLGVQDLDGRVQAAIGRLQPAATVEAAMAALRAAGLGRINVDLIYGLPHQTEDSLAATCRAVADLAPDRIACYGYAHLPDRRANQRLIDAAALPGPEARFRQAALVGRRLAERGYQPVGIDHYARLCDPLAVAARKGRLRRNFQGYTDDAAPVLLGFGASAISRFEGGYVQNLSDVAAYRSRVAEERLPSSRGHVFSAEDRERGAVIERLMCDFRVDLGGLADRFAEELALLRPLAVSGLLTVSGGVIEMTRRGRPFVRLAAKVFDAYRLTDGARFSASV